MKIISEESVDIFNSSTIKTYYNSSRSMKLFNQSNRPPEDIAEFQQQLEELFAEVKSMIRMGNVNDAINLLQANYANVREQIDEGANGMEQAAILDILALGYMALGDFKMVKFLLDTVISFLLQIFLDDKPCKCSQLNTQLLVHVPRLIHL